MLATSTCAFGASLSATAGAPTCGTGCQTVSGTNSVMVVTTTLGATSAQVNFGGGGFAKAPVCVAARTNDASNAKTVAVAPVPDHLIVGVTTGLSSQETVNVICFAH